MNQEVSPHDKWGLPVGGRAQGWVVLKLLVSRPLASGKSSSRQANSSCDPEKAGPGKKIEVETKEFSSGKLRSFNEALQTRETHCESELVESCHCWLSWGWKALNDMDTGHVLGSVLGAYL